MSQKYFDENGIEISEEQFNRDREELLARRAEAMKNPAAKYLQCFAIYTNN